MTLVSEADAMTVDREFREMLIAIVRFEDGEDVERCVAGAAARWDAFTTKSA